MIKFTLLLGIVSACSGIKLDGLRVKVGWTGEPANKEYFFEIPRTIDEAVKEGYKRTRRPVGPLPELRLYCPPGRAVCPMFDDSGFVAGLQLAIPTDEFEVIPVKPEKHFVKWVVKETATEPARTYWATSQYYVSEETLEDGVELDNNETLHDGGVWVKGPHGRLLRIPTTEVELNTTRFRKQSCVPNMGTHYFYNLSKKLRCEDMFPWFPLTSQGQLIGVGFQTYGKVTRLQEPEREWFEHDTFRKGSMKLVAPDSPDCLHDWYERYYGVFLHIYYINDPWNLRCRTTNCPFCFPDGL